MRILSKWFNSLIDCPPPIGYVRFHTRRNIKSQEIANMGKKKRFDKKNATHFHIVHRSQRDVAEDEHGNRSEHVLVPQDGDVKSTAESDAMENIKDKLAQMDILADDEEYDYSKHYRYMGGGDYLSAETGKISNQKLDPRAVDIPVETMEVERMLESINLDPKFIDDDIHDALFGFEEGDFEEILDDFCTTAAQAPDDDGGQAAFDYDAHIQAMIQKAKAAENGGSVGGQANDQKIDEFFKNSKPLGHEDADSDAEDSWDQEFGGQTSTIQTSYHNPNLNPDEERAMLEKFEQTLAEYDSDEVGDLYNIEEEIVNEGAVDVFEENNAMEAIFDEYLEAKNDDKLFEGSKIVRSGGSGYSYLHKGRMVRADEVDQDGEDNDSKCSESEEPIEMLPELSPPEEEVLIDGKSYFTERTVNPWDCESILSTYSNLDNNPSIIGSSRRRKTKKQGMQKEIMLSSKTGLPIGVLPVTEKAVKLSTNVDTQQLTRRRGETREERKARKEATKKMKQEARLQKRIMKGAFAEEFAKRSIAIGADDVGGVPVFRYT